MFKKFIIFSCFIVVLTMIVAFLTSNSLFAMEGFLTIEISDYSDSEEEDYHPLLGGILSIPIALPGQATNFDNIIESNFSQNYVPIRLMSQEFSADDDDGDDECDMVIQPSIIPEYVGIEDVSDNAVFAESVSFNLEDEEPSNITQSIAYKMLLKRNTPSTSSRAIKKLLSSEGESILQPSPLRHVFYPEDTLESTEEFLDL